MARSLWDAEASLYDAMRTVQVSVGGVVGTMTEGFSFDAPVVCFSSIRNTPLSGRGSVTVSGLSFGSSVYTATAAIGSAPCSTSMWTSGTSVGCQMGIAEAPSAGLKSRCAAGLEREENLWPTKS